jgi:hypothetical protein
MHGPMNVKKTKILLRIVESKDEVIMISLNVGNYAREGRGLHYRSREYTKWYLFYTDRTAALSPIQILVIV